MRVLHSILGALQLGAVAAQGYNDTEWPIQDNGLTTQVQWDRYSLIINGERLHMWSGEFHPFRLPVPELWPDVLDKMKAAGFNFLSIYLHWGWHSAADGDVDFENGSHNIRPIYEYAKQIGLYIVVRPGPYINAESTGGGYPGWLLTGEYGSLRNNDSRYTAAWEPYMDEFAQLTQEYSITQGGTVVLYQLDNEYGQQWEDVDERIPNNTAIHYMELLEESTRRSGVDMPTIHNNPNFNTKSWSTDYDINNEGGNTDLYSLDHYPSCWSCKLETCSSLQGFPPEFTTFDYYTNFQETAPSHPQILGEFQGGSYNPWGGPEGGCRGNTGPEWANVYYRHNVGNRVTATNIYMLFGGTNWGGLPFPQAITSYDYAAGIQETRMLWDKYSEMKLLGYFMRAAKGLTRIELVDNGTTDYRTNNEVIFAQGLRNIDDESRFYVVKHENTTMTSREEFKLTMRTSVGEIEAPQYAPDIVIDGRQAKILVTDFAAGDQHIIYSTSEILAVSAHPSTIMAFWVPTGESGEFYLKDVQHGNVVRCEGCSNIQFQPADDGLIVVFTQNEGMTVLTFDNGARAIIVDRSVAYKMWQPTLSNDPRAPLDQTLLVHGPELVRSASVHDNCITLTGDYNGTTGIEVFPPSCNAHTTLTFNGHTIKTETTSYGSVVGTLPGGRSSLDKVAASLPDLNSWRATDALPERHASYDDTGAAWVAADASSTLNPWQPETYPVLYADEYGFHAQNILWRGHFPASSPADSVFLKVFGGVASGFSAWLNGQFLGSATGNDEDEITNATLAFHDAKNTADGGENVLLVLQDHTGHGQTVKALDPRGILNATLLGGGNFTEWRVAGKAGGQDNIDPIRGPLNEGGLTAERLGWHLPGFDGSESWEADVSPQIGFEGAGVRFYRTVVPLDLPSGYDYSLAFELETPDEALEMRVQLYVNGYMFGKFIPHIGPQTSFPVFPGILDYNGDNTIGLSVWAQSPQGARLGVRPRVGYMLESSLQASEGTGYLRPGWQEEREMYV
ncbi:hypothetical protein MBLNU230_g1257t1 [Neophaeotheca triangularis]